MTARVEVAVELREDVRAGLAALAAAASDLTPAMREIAGHLADETRERFESGVGPTGVPWKKSARVINHGGQTLVDHDDLLSSIIEDWGADYAAAGPEASGGAAIYAAIHQFGGTIRPKTGKALRFGPYIVSKVVMPARPYLGFTDADADATVDILGRHLARRLGDGGEGAAA